VKPTVLPTRVARRILTLFVVCGVVPAAGLSAVAYFQIASVLEQRAIDRLLEQATTVGMLLRDRLLMAATILESVDRAETAAPSAAQSRIHLIDDIAFDSLGGRLDLLPASARRQVEAGRPALVVAGRGDSILVAREVRDRAGERRLLVGRVEPGALWGTERDPRLVPGGVELCVLAERVTLYCTGRAAIPPETVDDGGPRSRSWRSGGERIIAAERELGLGFELGLASWRLVVSQPAGAVLAPLSAFRTTFWLAALLALAGAFALGNRQIRRLMAPLHELEHGTRRLAVGDLRHRVAVATDDEFGSLAASFNGMAQSLTRQFGTLQALQRLGRAALATPEVEAVARTAAVAAQEVIAGTSATLVAARSDPEAPWIAVTVTAQNGGARITDLNPSIDAVDQLREGGEYFVLAPGEPRPGFVPANGADTRDVVLPLRRGQALAGALVLSLPPRGSLDDAALRHARVLADQVDMALSNAYLVDKLDDLTWGALVALARTIDANSPWTAGHSERVTQVAMAIGRSLGLDPAELDLLHRGGLLHDIGKIAVPASILDKPARLTDDERRAIEAHPATGARILAPIAAYRDVIPLVRWHHEALDGTGYPDGLEGADIPDLVRILTVADVFDALVSERPYRPAWPTDHAVSYLIENAGRKFDREVVDAFAQSLRVNPGAVSVPLPSGLARKGHPSGVA
jgi:putative nucleotidyltransferase with HDIG domain